MFKHSGLAAEMPWVLESHETRAFIKIFPFLIMALANGGVLVIDEMDAAIHARILPDLLQDFARTANLPISLNIKELAPGAGDSLARVEMAVRLIKQESAVRVAPAASFVLLDEDQTVLAPARAETARQLATQKNIKIVWKRLCFEAVLLRHLPGCHTRRPPDTPGACAALQEE